MALKKSDLYSALWTGYDELRGGADARQCNGYVLPVRYTGSPCCNSDGKTR